MDIKYALLGFLNWKPATGYEMKKLVAESVAFEWSGNNNQIYTSLVQLAGEGLVTQEVQVQERYPARKVYTITEAGRQELRNWLTEAIEPPQFRKLFLVKLAWSHQLGNDELIDILNRYKNEIELQIDLLQERIQKGIVNPSRSPRERYLWNRISVNYLTGYSVELMWVEQIIEDIRTGTYKEIHS